MSTSKQRKPICKKCGGMLVTFIDLEDLDTKKVQCVKCRTVFVNAGERCNG